MRGTGTAAMSDAASGMLVVRGGTVVTARGHAPLDVLIRAGQVAALLPCGEPADALYAGREVRGQVVATVLHGTVTAWRGEPTGPPGGRFLPGPGAGQG
jgi:dihydroorotase-like cyclic amidohydrolase